MPGQTEVGGQQKEKTFIRNVTFSHNTRLCTLPLRVLAQGICKPNCGLSRRSLAKTRPLRINTCLCVSTPNCSVKRSERESTARSTVSQTHSSASEPAAGQGVGSCTSSPSKATRLSGRLKQAGCLALSYKELRPAGGLLSDGEVIKMDSHPAKYL